MLREKDTLNLKKITGFCPIAGISFVIEIINIFNNLKKLKQWMNSR